MGQKTPNEEQQELRQSILRAAHGDEEHTADGDDLFQLKEKTDSDRKHEEESFAAFTSTQDKDRRNKTDAEDIAARYWKADEDLDESERFLRDYILSKAWMETTSMQAPGSGGPEGDDDGEADEEHLDKTDDFEKEYNFRFEMEDGQQIQGHQRVITSSVRQRDDTRKRKRKEKAERQAVEKIRRTEELKRLKNLKKQEILRRLKQLQEVTGNADVPLTGKVDLDKDFDPEAHDKEMSEMFNEDYEQAQEPLAPEDLVRAPEGLEELDVSAAAADALERRRAAERRGKKAATAAGTAAAPSEAAAEAEAEDAEAMMVRMMPKWIRTCGGFAMIVNAEYQVARSVSTAQCARITPSA